MSSYVPDEILNIVEKCYLFKVFSKVGVGCDGEKCYSISKINDDEELSGRFKCHILRFLFPKIFCLIYNILFWFKSLIYRCED